VIVIGNNWTKFSVGWFAGPYKEGCWPWRLALYKKSIISLGFSFWVVLVKYFQVETSIVSLKFGDI
jgi:hypothetical protein